LEKFLGGGFAWLYHKRRMKRSYGVNPCCKASSKRLLPGIKFLHISHGG